MRLNTATPFFPRYDLPQFVRTGNHGNDRGGMFRSHDDDHADPHVEGIEHIPLGMSPPLR